MVTALVYYVVNRMMQGLIAAETAVERDASQQSRKCMISPRTTILIIKSMQHIQLKSEQLSRLRNKA